MNIIFSILLLFAALTALNALQAALTLMSKRNFFIGKVFNSGKIFLLYIVVKMLVILRVMPWALMRFFINLNNRLVRTVNKGYNPKSVLVLLPRCLQNQSCVNAVVEEISNCRSCGRCNIGDIKNLQGGNVKILLATGGKIAVDFIAKNKPEYVVAVACEKELFAGIGEIRKIPVYAVLNDQPEGPCKNTGVDSEILRNLIIKGDQVYE